MKDSFDENRRQGKWRKRRKETYKGKPMNKDIDKGDMDEEALAEQLERMNEERRRRNAIKVVVMVIVVVAIIVLVWGLG